MAEKKNQRANPLMIDENPGKRKIPWCTDLPSIPQHQAILMHEHFNELMAALTGTPDAPENQYAFELFHRLTLEIYPTNLEWEDPEIGRLAKAVINAVLELANQRMLSFLQVKLDQESPQWEHDCAICTFLGRYAKMDLYFCTQGSGTTTVIARYGSHGHDYESGMQVAYQLRAANRLKEPLVVALTRAEGRKLVE